MTTATFNRKRLLEAFQIGLSVTTTNTPKEILKCSLLSVSPEGASLESTNSEIAARSRLRDVTAKNAVEALVPTAQVAQILGLLSSEEIDASFEESSLVLKAGGSRFNVPVHNAAEFPRAAAVESKASVMVPASVLGTAIRRTVFAMDPDSTRFALSGVCFDTKDSALTLVATDSRQLCVMPAGVSIEPQGKDVMVPAKAMQAVAKAIGEGETTISFAGNSIAFECGDVTITSRLLEGRFPDWRGVVPKYTSGFSANLVAGPLSAAISQAAIASSEESKGLDFAFSGDLLAIDGQAQGKGEAHAELPVATSGDSVTITLDPRLLGMLLKALRPETSLLLKLNGPENAALFEIDDGFKYVLMPLSRDR